ncbi:MAG: hypothetical protein A2X70_04425 [Alphaproteobacteria bacterium GWC2_42_16]|nr:MAG: hypothetical protein A2X70_04425 [Alphaproteobacteria bacterium GWC2_42_16]OFW73329.1 MAG: hypothetical protein A2Z80_07515 [Alphaproteobacteria bacterium GWA2_41_27]OFW81795.1 MAG: hypothetical protein A3E50_02780 [Alphaproteobacteria bacterium RIFCSPHIGHO2_12_FULL_42_100]OFW85686.1 MAG: hypothetical protein A2W06_06450 [Alphaproteobacteria bacterium RBG_16_42_14]OFW90821.1 MAG: hypothetical protein A3C41_01850 [Alphaproteobacteria bacterium RIFCSPHIGHO2_02_FULL_42_30]OFW92442.1 MAG: 
MEKLLLTPEALAERWNITPATLSQWRWNGRGPLFIKMNKGVRYRLSDIERFEEQHTCQNTSQKILGVALDCRPTLKSDLI